MGAWQDWGQTPFLPRATRTACGGRGARAERYRRSRVVTEGHQETPREVFRASCQQFGFALRGDGFDYSPRDRRLVRKVGDFVHHIWFRSTYLDRRDVFVSLVIGVSVSCPALNAWKRKHRCLNRSPAGVAMADLRILQPDGSTSAWTLGPSAQRIDAIADAVLSIRKFALPFFAQFEDAQRVAQLLQAGPVLGFDEPSTQVDFLMCFAGPQAAERVAARWLRDTDGSATGIRRAYLRQLERHRARGLPAELPTYSADALAVATLLYGFRDLTTVEPDAGASSADRELARQRKQSAGAAHPSSETSAAAAAAEDGPVCGCCGQRIPQFRSLSAADAKRILALRAPAAEQALRKLVGCTRGEAMRWVRHGGKALPWPSGRICQFCAGFLRSATAKQCFTCGIDWHDPTQLRLRIAADAPAADRARAWEFVREWFRPDGALRDIYVAPTDPADWQRMLGSLSEWGWQETWTRNGEPASPIDTVDAAFTIAERENLLLRIERDDVRLHCHFFVVDEIEFDLDPHEVRDVARFDSVLRFVVQLGERLRKPVTLTMENAPTERILGYDPAVRGFEFRAPPAGGLGEQLRLLPPG